MSGFGGMFMRRLPKPDADRRANSLRSVAASLCLAVLASFVVGCDDPPQNLSTLEKRKNEAEERFDWAMERLRRALETFNPSPTLGLRVKRELSFELLPPTADQPRYTAQVTIKSKTFYKPGKYLPEEDEELSADEPPNRLDPNGEFSEGFEQPVDPAELYQVSPKMPVEKPMMVNNQVPAPQIEKQGDYELIYQDNRWQLVEEPESDQEKMWFEYALQP